MKTSKLIGVALVERLISKLICILLGRHNFVNEKVPAEYDTIKKYWLCKRCGYRTLFKQFIPSTDTTQGTKP